MSNQDNLQQTTNGFLQYLIDRENKILEVISEKYSLNLDDLKKDVFEVCDKPKPKSIKPQKRQPKKNVTDNKKPRKPSAYQIFAAEKRDLVNKLLIDEPKERTFLSKEGKTIVIDKDSFKNNKPSFMDVGRKIASMWATLDETEIAIYKEKSKNSEPVVKELLRGRGKKDKNTSEADSTASHTSKGNNSKGDDSSALVTSEESEDEKTTTSTSTTTKSKELPTKKKMGGQGGKKSQQKRKGVKK